MLFSGVPFTISGDHQPTTTLWSRVFDQSFDRPNTQRRLVFPCGTRGFLDFCHRRLVSPHPLFADTDVSSYGATSSNCRLPLAINLEPIPASRIPLVWQSSLLGARFVKPCLDRLVVLSHEFQSPSRSIFILTNLAFPSADF